MKNKFPDISYYQGYVDWGVLASKSSNVIIRAMHGVTKDLQFDNNWKAAKAAGIRRGIYLFYEDTSNPQSQANALCSLIKSDLPETRIWVDWENTYNGQYQGLGNVVACMKQIEANLPGSTVGMYTGFYWFKDHTNASSNATEYTYLKSHPLWLADYDSLPQVPLPWTGVPELHQIGTPAEGLDYGVQSKEIDINVILSSYETYGWKAPDAISGMEAIGQIWYKVTANVLNIRNGAGAITEGSDIGDLTLNSKVLCNGLKLVGNTLWAHFIDARTQAGESIKTSNGQLVSQRSDCWCSCQYLLYTDEAVPSPLQPIDGTLPPVEGPKPPQSITIIDDAGISWKATTFTKL